MRRSLLFIPANSPAMLQNADIFASDGVIFDLEDAVTLSEKDAALHLLDQYLNTTHFNTLEVIIRINGLDTKLGFRDLEFMIDNRIDTIMLPKANVKTTLTLSHFLKRMERKKKLNKKIGIIPIIESASSVLEASEIAKIDRVNGLLLGAEDLATDLEVERTQSGQEIFLARSLVILVAKANQIDAIDTPFTHVDDEIALKEDSLLAKSLGMNAKACIHPLQIDIVNEVFSPGREEILYAQKVLKAEVQAIKENKGAFSVDGKMIDKPIIYRAKKLLEKAEKWNLL
ncbi:HpcH/HpaI aldolase/citrate lyase family protein [Peloplasma aerotolerans]|uniref:Aldolase/citrate lyase family protein n=1 Tax=Peloplasma aerotolerans TaxID=3044389 RepID=A0AAW6U647_9MOLU|nr:aldolase/citrate lyase family protein [Mariniplasma sp. M4Ah]MDI6453377.1 aldolase/citrate lyase family protein [Mariniplasma sp. M4Ah]MDR4968377.1 aldolase/citrate lyase family protein [Acholeplasmataceae bacterium]